MPLRMLGEGTECILDEDGRAETDPATFCQRGLRVEEGELREAESGSWPLALKLRAIQPELKVIIKGLPQSKQQQWPASLATCIVIEGSPSGREGIGAAEADRHRAARPTQQQRRSSSHTPK